MPVRTTSDLVKAVLGRDYDSVDQLDLMPYIAAASNLIDQTVSAAATMRQPPVSIPAETAELMERWLAADTYTQTDPLYTSRSTGGASGSFLRSKIEPRPYRETAAQLDPSGCLTAILNGYVARAGWLGKRESEQVPYRERQ